ncbi:MAG: ADP-ribosylglycohydrolase family protein, partial [Armatimonadetes bacterium]|nr:ADP-ribosylglycohydrolase family protein [Candidatus Hippobium faecium]
MKIKKSEFYDKVLGCWMGKNIGGTLGTPDEWKRQLNNYSFYTHNIDGEPLPNDDLDLQIIWLKCLENNGINITARNLAECWLMFQIANYGEYGVAKANLRQGIMPPQSGILNNAKKHSCGAFIRSEIWACICPGRPDLAVKYAYEDAIVDHGDGEGTYAEFFTASAEAAAFVTDDIRKLIEIGLSYIPEDCGVAKAVRCVIDCYENKIPWQETRDVILEKFSGCVPDHLEFLCSERDREKGYDKGVLGYDVPSNIAIIVAGLLYGEGDFEKSLLITANMGEDTDCTAGFVGALYGIIMGAKNLPEKWVAPIGHNIKTMCCNLAHGAEYVPETVEELTERVIRQTMAVSSSKGGFNKEPTMDIFDEGETDLSDVEYEKLLFQNTELYKNREVMLNLTGPRHD